MDGNSDNGAYSVQLGWDWTELDKMTTNTLTHTHGLSDIITSQLIRLINLIKFFTGKNFLGQKSHWTIVSLDNCVIGQKSLGQLSPWTIVPWTIVATPYKRL